MFDRLRRRILLASAWYKPYKLDCPLCLREGNRFRFKTNSRDLFTRILMEHNQAFHEL